jgi:diguanylate cyclase (GGDEF)-like protein
VCTRCSIIQSSHGCSLFLQDIIVPIISILLAVALWAVVKRDRKISSLTYRDPLTGLRNKRSYDKDCAGIRTQHPDQVCYISIDLAALGFCNTALGHEGADEVIKFFASELEAKVQSADCKGKAYRKTNGDEFAVICFPKSAEALEELVSTLGSIAFESQGTLGAYESQPVSAWLRVGAVWRTGGTPEDADELEAEVKVAIIASGTPLEKGKPVPPLSELRVPTYLIDTGGGGRAHQKQAASHEGQAYEMQVLAGDGGIESGSSTPYTRMD